MDLYHIQEISCWMLNQFSLSNNHHLPAKHFANQSLTAMGMMSKGGKI